MCSLTTPHFDAPSNVQLQPAVEDFYEIDKIDFKRRPNAKFAWFMLGCTFGNLDEEKFLSALKRATRAGDLFILGVDVHLNEALDAERKRISAYYASNEIVQFFTSPLREAWSEHHVPTEDIQNSLKSAEFNLVSGVMPHHSDVPSSLTLAIVARHRELERTVLVSTRYSKPALIDYIGQERFNFKLVDERAAQGCSYNQLIFERSA